MAANPIIIVRNVVNQVICGGENNKGPKRDWLCTFECNHQQIFRSLTEQKVPRQARCPICEHNACFKKVE